MTMTELKHEESPVLWIGVDVSKKTFTAAAKFPALGDVIRPEDSGTAENNRSGARWLCRWVGTLEERFKCPAGIAMEATGTYSSRLYENLMRIRPELHVSICNPLSVSHYMHSLGMNKTDSADAAVIARFAEHRRPVRYAEPSRDQKELRRLSRDRDFLIESRTEYKNRMEAYPDPSSRRRMKKIVTAISAQIDEIEAELNKYLSKDASQECRSEIELMQTAPGVGRLSAAIIYGELGSLAGYTRKQLSAMSGICPVTRQSGTSLHKGGLSKRGPKGLRRILYLDSTQTIQLCPAMAAFHDRMLAKPNSRIMSARVACMRKLLLMLRGIVVSGKAYDPNHVSVRPDLQRKNPEKSEKTA